MSDAINVTMGDFMVPAFEEWLRLRGLVMVEVPASPEEMEAGTRAYVVMLHPGPGLVVHPS